jgi:DNA-directed RNA polymerase subunit RPC12/RpoP
MAMRETRKRHECINPRCGRRFVIVYKHDPEQPVLPLHVACPHCGLREFLLVGTAGTREPDGTYVMAVDFRVEAQES